MPANPFVIANPASGWFARAATLTARPFLNSLLRLPTYQQLYVDAQSADHRSFEDRALAVLRIQSVIEGDLSRIPSSGPLIVAANHPHGALDGLLLAAIIRRRRHDVRILTNFLLSRIPDLEEFCFFVDPFGGPASKARSQAGLRAAHLWLKQGGALIIFPAGEVAHRFDRATPGRRDSEWHTTVGRLSLAAGASVLPVFIEGTNSRLFYAAGRVHPMLRTALLARELLNKQGSCVTLRVGAAIAARELGQGPSDASAATYRIRSAVERLRQPILQSTTLQSIKSEVERLPKECLMVSGGDFDVFLIGAASIPATLGEIGRLRESTYRGVGEGTGRNTDLDEFDDHYLHLFAWDRKREQIVGAYRIGQTDRVVATHGVSGLYTRTLFRYDEQLLDRMAPALELGRSFVRAEYQRNYGALLMLWKGIGQLVARNPQYAVLFGPVSVSARYSHLSHDLLKAFLEQNHLHADLARLVEAINPGRAAANSLRAVPASIDAVDRLIAAAERDGKGVPVLLRQYLKLNARLLGFNVDPRFGDALDALMMVDLRTVHAGMLNRYLGRAETASFLAYHHGGKPAQAA